MYVCSISSSPYKHRFLLFVSFCCCCCGWGHPSSIHHLRHFPAMTLHTLTFLPDDSSPSLPTSSCDLLSHLPPSWELGGETCLPWRQKDQACQATTLPTYLPGLLTGLPSLPFPGPGDGWMVWVVVGGGVGGGTGAACPWHFVARAATFCLPCLLPPCHAQHFCNLPFQCCVSPILSYSVW